MLPLDFLLTFDDNLGEKDAAFPIRIYSQKCHKLGDKHAAA